MNDIVIIPGKSDSPTIQMNIKTNVYELIGNSFPDNPKETYAPLTIKIGQNVSKGEEVTLIINLDYINTGSKNILLSIFSLMEQNKSKSEIRWYYSDEDMFEEIEFLEECGETNINKIFKPLV